MESQIASKLKQLNTSNPLQALKSFLVVRPVGCKTKVTIVQDLEALQAIIAKVPEKEFSNFIAQLTQEECQLTLDYLHRFMQHIGESDANILAGSLLSLYQKIVVAHGPSIIIKAVSRNDTIVNRVVNY